MLKILNKKIIILAVFAIYFLFFNIFLAKAETEKYYTILLKIDEKIININISNNNLFQNNKNEKTDLYYVLKNNKQEILKQEDIKKNQDDINPLGNIKDAYFFQIEFNQNADTIYIYNKKNNQEILNSSLKQFKYCGNNICDKTENYLICAIDCPAGTRDGYCDSIRDRICDIDCLTKYPYKDLDCYEIDKIKNKAEYDDFVQSQITYNQNKNNNNKIEINKLQAIFSLTILFIGILILFISIYYWYSFIYNKNL